jgi:hypothetical protein
LGEKKKRVCKERKYYVAVLRQDGEGEPIWVIGVGTWEVLDRKSAHKWIASATKGTYRVFESIEDPVEVSEDSVQLTMLRTTRTVGGKTTVTEEEVAPDA